MKNPEKTTDLTPGGIYYRVDVYKKNEIGICKGYFNNHFDALINVEHDKMVDSLPCFEPCSQITAVLIQPNGDEVNIHNQFFI